MSPVSAQFKKLIMDERLRRGLEVARQQVENGAQMIDINMDEGMLDSEAAMVTFLQPDRLGAGYRPRAGDGRFVEVERDRGRTASACRAKAWSIRSSLKEGEAEFIEHARKVRRYGAAAVVMAFDEEGQADTCRAQGRRSARAAYKIC